ncbi:unnamed protein product [Brachionus calyciflorus]|uniref:V-SNARE coiled-coil homology domain-containing protein n=1 Tax=Brachionus calyciflorus TaxID=104777 RepID=A0A813M1I6_9BILA|nr:unnamed protein product [Brachionus calyciflorus]
MMNQTLQGTGIGERKTDEESSKVNEKIEQTQNEIDEIKCIMKDNIEKMMHRGINLNELKNSCDHLEEQAAQFQMTAKKESFLRPFTETILTIKEFP